jgi:anti-sigma-K factor RskA
LSVQHPIRAEDLELLALGVIDGQECRDLRAHLASCAECARNFAAAQGQVALFAVAAPPEDPPPSVRENLLARIRAEKSAQTAARRPGAHGPSRWWNSFAVPAATVLAIATILLWVNDRRLDNQLHQMQQTAQNFQQQTRHAQALVSFLAAGDTKSVSLMPRPKASTAGAWAQVRYNSRMGMICYNGDLPAPPPDKEYQMWIVPMVGNPISAGAFMPASFSNGHMCMAKMPEGITCKDFGVTIEPMGGMPRPTGPVVLASAP